MAITSNVAVTKWYQENTSVWTLDYPPFFAWFEYGLSQVANVFDPSITVLSKQPMNSFNTVIFQRFSVVCTDVLYVIGAVGISSAIKDDSALKNLRREVLILLLCLNPCLLLVDNIHFQYNGFLFGVFLLSIREMYLGNVLLSSAYFTALLNLKQLFLYIAPAYGVYIFNKYLVIDGHSPYRFSKRIAWSRCCRLFMVVVFIFSLSLAPFLYANQLGTLVSRLFPFKRGLTHAYWAPNFWAMYSFADLSLHFVCNKLNFTMCYATTATAGYTTGIVQDFAHLVLPRVTPLVTFVIVLLGLSPLAVSFMRPVTPDAFVKMLVACAFSSFLFGWHVHEKAVIMIIVPLTILALNDRSYAKIFLLIFSAGLAGLFPLFARPFESVLKYGVFVVYFGIAYMLLHKMHGCGGKISLLTVPELFYVLGIVCIEFYCRFAHTLLFTTRLPFMPLLITSVYCAIGVVYSWILFCWHFLLHESVHDISVRTIKPT
ncbi:unnamed protein product [Soboliphyme baturini]|uniref:Alpha-1,3-glucosyltransferase n=1 Tax=Soboliphyme baturini TaxID=241478 RepID=A0A183ICS0_9BILA|nr:unnamed protein product [Soboliphyme baturini]